MAMILVHAPLPPAIAAPRRLTGPFLLALLLATACSREPEPPGESAPPRGVSAAAAPRAAVRAASVRRLVDALGAAQLSSPLSTIEAAARLDQVDGPVARRTLLAESFDHFDAAALGMPGQVAIKPRPGSGDGNAALAYRGRDAHRVFFLVPAEPGSHYRVARSVRGREPTIDFVVAESHQALRHPAVRNHPLDVARIMQGRFVNSRHLLYVHRFPRQANEGAWERGDIELYTTPSTRALVLVLQDTEAAAARRGVTTWFDDLLVERLEPSRAQELQLLKARDSRARWRRRGRHGQARPAPARRQTSPRSRRPTIQLRLSLRDPRPGPDPHHLPARHPGAGPPRLSAGLHKASRPGDSATFRVAAQPDGEAACPLFEETVTIGAEGEGWAGTSSASPSPRSAASASP